MDDLFAKKNKKKKGKKKINFNVQLNTGTAMDTEDPTEKIRRMKNESAMKESIVKATTDSDWSDTIEVAKKKAVINTAGKGLAEFGYLYLLLVSIDIRSHMFLNCREMKKEEVVGGV